MKTAKFSLFIEAQIFELKHMDANAIELYYNSLFVVLDSDERLERLLKGIPLETTAPVLTCPKHLDPIAAQVTQRIDTRYGPGKAYAK